MNQYKGGALYEAAKELDEQYVGNEWYLDYNKHTGKYVCNDPNPLATIVNLTQLLDEEFDG